MSGTNITVVPAIIPQSFEDLEAHVSKVKEYVDTVQIDILDQKFAPSISWPFKENSKVQLPQNTDIRYEIDMMVERPEQYIDQWIAAGAHALILHVGSTTDLEGVIQDVHAKGVQVGIAVRPQTRNEEFAQLIPEIDFVQFMGNQKIGYHGVTLDESVVTRVADLRSRHPDLIIAVDIGVNFETAPKLVQAGVTKLVSGSAIFKSDDIKVAIEKLRAS